jgi:hypothetical protein
MPAAFFTSFRASSNANALRCHAAAEPRSCKCNPHLVRSAESTTQLHTRVSTYHAPVWNIETEYDYAINHDVAQSGSDSGVNPYSMTLEKTQQALPLVIFPPKQSVYQSNGTT